MLKDKLITYKLKRIKVCDQEIKRMYINEEC